MTLKGPLDQLSKQLEDGTFFQDPMPLECNQIIQEINCYSFKELLDLLDLWHLNKPDFQNKSTFISLLRKRVQFLKHQPTAEEIKKEKKTPPKSKYRERRDIAGICKECGNVYIVKSSQSKYCSELCKNRAQRKRKKS